LHRNSPQNAASVTGITGGLSSSTDRIGWSVHPADPRKLAVENLRRVRRDRPAGQHLQSAHGSVPESRLSSAASPARPTTGRSFSEARDLVLHRFSEVGVEREDSIPACAIAMARLLASVVLAVAGRGDVTSNVLATPCGLPK